MTEKGKSSIKKEEKHSLLVFNELYNLYSTNKLFNKQKSFMYQEMLSYKKQLNSLQEKMAVILATNPNETTVLERMTKEILEKDKKIIDLENKVNSVSQPKEKNTFSEQSLKLKEQFDFIIENISQENSKKEFLELQNEIEKIKEEKEELISEQKKEIFELVNKNKSLEGRINKFEKEYEDTEVILRSERQKHKEFSQLQTDAFLEAKYKLEENLEKKIKEICELRPEFDFLKRNNDELKKRNYELNNFLKESQKNWENYKKLVYNSKNVTDATLIEELGNLSEAFDSIAKSYSESQKKIEEYLKKIDDSEKMHLEKVKQLEKKIEYLNSFTNDKNDNFIIYMEKLMEVTEYKMLVSQSENSLNSLKKKFESLFLNYEAEKEKNEELIKKIQEIYKKNEQKNSEINSLKEKMMEYESTNKTFKRIIDSVVENGSADVFDELEKYKKILRCMACDVNYKDTVITKCMHVFCHDCIEKRLKSRLRKCPNCGEQFHFNDVHKIYL